MGNERRLRIITKSQNGKYMNIYLVLPELDEGDNKNKRFLDVLDMKRKENSEDVIRTLIKDNAIIQDSYYFYNWKIKHVQNSGKKIIELIESSVAPELLNSIPKNQYEKELKKIRISYTLEPEIQKLLETSPTVNSLPG
jgi:hypothetical protein